MLRFRRPAVFLSTLLLLVSLLSTASAGAAEPVRFAVPPWPGVTVKSTVVCQLLEALGYETHQEEIGPVIAYNSMGLDEVDVCLAGWTPQQNPMLEPLLEKGTLELLHENLGDALIGLCVPEYTYEAGVHSIADLDAHADKFNNTIYNIEAGSGMHTSVAEIIENDVAGLGDWEQIGSTTPMMLTQVGDMMKNGEWAVFGCWKPHWMNVVLDMKYLEAVPGSEVLVTTSKVYTVVRTGLDKDMPEVYAFLKRFEVPSSVQDGWIYAYGYKKQPVEEVAREWIVQNMDLVQPWFEGLHSVDGKPASDVLSAAFAQ
ncbi:glycine betaine/proline transport system substrate-binding protein [Paucidesulfovibrio gracilis DSM 16080]|uniref:Glycine betaine/proline transport system substrate-binding protein n=1 Tax=Paucidesulfovibrio gracilis DSM 16080 TaxID=1121449 RepID=A0A1T4Y567_9BACT|nr:glycine betaine ABC transporter substrate-binding protein [Paucidesulfovibrio gracilis]SKA96962.1 glycine betaine/proline transport system substrate-binding protein [Paucidesulfovibrio gracilis DSM 16080]